MCQNAVIPPVNMPVKVYQKVSNKNHEKVFVPTKMRFCSFRGGTFLSGFSASPFVRAFLQM